MPSQRLVFLAPICTVLLAVWAQVSVAQSSRDTVFIPKPKNLRALFAEDLAAEQKIAPLRFAVKYPTKITPANKGTWEIVPGGTAIWRLKILADDSVSLNLGFDRFFLPRSGQLLISTPQRSLRPFTAVDNEVHGQLWTPPLKGQEIDLELRVSTAERAKVVLSLNHINYGYRDFTTRFDSSSRRKSGACNVDVACVADVPAFKNVIRSVAAITVSGSHTCSGSLVNNSAHDYKMYFLTADHCGITAGKAPSMVAIWNYQNSKCREPGSAESGQDGDGKQDQFHSGAIFRARFGPSDFTLLELDDPPNPEFKHYWAGWNRSTDDFPGVVGVHHPRVADKRIALSNLPSQTTSYTGKEVPGDGTHIRVVKWTSGTTEPGSSGSPLYDEKQRLVGQLHGGAASCRVIEGSDWYGRLSTSWEGGGTPETSLKTWLDPKKTGALTIDGLNGPADRRARR